MKKRKLNISKLNLNKEVISDLNKVKGGLRNDSNPTFGQQPTDCGCNPTFGQELTDCGCDPTTSGPIICC